MLGSAVLTIVVSSAVRNSVSIKLTITGIVRRSSAGSGSVADVAAAAKAQVLTGSRSRKWDKVRELTIVNPLFTGIPSRPQGQAGGGRSQPAAQTDPAPPWQGH